MNITLLKNALDAIADEPHRWNQNMWVNTEQEPCSTSMCLAGWILLKSEHYILGQNATVYTSYDPWAKRVLTNIERSTDFFHVVHRKFLNQLMRDAYESNPDTGSQAQWTTIQQAMILLGMDPKDHDQYAAMSRIFHTVSGPAVRNPDAFRGFVVSVLLSESLITANEAASLLIVDNDYASDYFEDESTTDPWADDDRNEPPVSDEPPF